MWSESEEKMNRYSYCWLLALGISAAIGTVGCYSPPSNPRRAKPERPRALLNSTSVRSNDQSYWVVFAPTPIPIPLNEPFSLEIEIYDGGTRIPSTLVRDRLKEVELTFDAWMPDHDHGMNVTPRVERIGAGHFRVHDVLFHMPGEWEVHFDLSRGAMTERTQAPIELD